MISVPDGVCFFVEGHGIDEASVYSQVKPITGHSRARRVWTITERVVSVSSVLEADKLAEVDAWFENDLQAGSLEFAAQVADQRDGDQLLWWTARWVDYSVEMLHFGRGRVFGTLFLTGEGSEIGPDTALSMEISVPLLDIRSSLYPPTSLAMEIAVSLEQTVGMAMEIEVALLGLYPSFILREDSGYLLREDGDKFARE